MTIAIAVRARTSATVAITFVGAAHATIACDAIAFSGAYESEARQRDLGEEVRFVNPIDDGRIIHTRLQPMAL